MQEQYNNMIIIIIDQKLPMKTLILILFCYSQASHPCLLHTLLC